MFDKDTLTAARNCVYGSCFTCGTDCPYSADGKPCMYKFARAILDEVECDKPYQSKPDEPRRIEPSSVDHPTYYQGEYECIDLMREIYGDDAVRNFCIINAYKYRFRAGKKQGETAQSDLDKADWYESYVMTHMPKNFEAWRDRVSAIVENNMRIDLTSGENE